MDFNADTYVELLVQIASAIHVPLRKRCEAPPWLDAAVEACLAENPARRPPEGLALASLLAAGPTSKAPQGSRARQALLGLLALGAAGAAGAILVAAPPPQPRLTPEVSRGSPAASTASDASQEDSEPSRFPASWSALVSSEHLTLTESWKPEGVTRASQVAIWKEGVMVVGEESVFALGAGPPRSIVRRLPGLRRSSKFSAEGAFFLLQEKTRFQVFRVENGALRCEGQTQPEGRLATLAFGGVSTVVAHGKRLATYKSLPNGGGRANPNFATLPKQPRLLAANKVEVMAAHESSVTFLDVLGEVQLMQDFESPVVAMAYRRGPSAGALIGTKNGALHCLDGGRTLRASIQTGLAPLQAVCAGERFAVAAGETGLALIDLEELKIVDRLDLSALESEIAGLDLSPHEDALAVGTEQGRVLRYALSSGKASTEVIGPKVSWGDRAARHAQQAWQVSASEGYLLSADGPRAIHVWDPDTGQALRTIRTPARSAPFVLGSRASLWAAAGDRLSQWDLSTGHELARFPLNPGALDLSISADKRHLTVLGHKGEVVTWNLVSQTRNRPRRISVARSRAWRLRVLNTGGYLVGFGNGTLALQDPSGAEIWTRETGGRGVMHLEFLSGGRALVADSRGQTSIWRLEDGERLLDFVTPPSTSLSLLGDQLLLGHSDGRIQLRSAKTGQAIWDRAGEVGIQPKVSLRSEREIFMAGKDRALRLVRLEGESLTPRDLWPRPPTSSSDPSLGFESKAKLMKVHSGWATTYDPDTGQKLSERDLGVSRKALWGRTHFVTLGVPRNGIGGGGGNGLYAWAVGALKPPRLVAPPPVNCVLSGNGGVLAYKNKQGAKGNIEILDLETLAKRSVNAGLSARLCLSFKGGLLASASASGLSCWSALDGRALFTRKESGVSAILRFLPTTPPLLFHAQLHGKVKLLDPEEGREVNSLTLSPPRHPVLVEPDPRGELVALSFTDGRLELWQTPGLRQLARLQIEDLNDPPLALAFSPEADQLAVLTGRGRLNVFAVPR